MSDLIASKHLSKNQPGHQSALEDSFAKDLKSWEIKLAEATEAQDDLQLVLDQLGTLI